MKKILSYLSLILLVNFLFLFAPEEPRSQYNTCPHTYLRLNRYMKVPFNCDEFAFAVGAAQPRYLLQKGYVRQSRPVFIIMGTIAGYTVYYASYPFHRTIQSFIQKKFTGQFTHDQLNKGILYGSMYTGFIILNIIILVCTLWLFEKIISLLSGPWKNSKWLWTGFMLMLLVNHVTKSFFWVAHEQMFTLLTPLLCIYTGLHIRKRELSFKQILLISSGGGILSLAYGNFLLLLPVLLFSYLLPDKKYKQRPKSSIFLMGLLITIVFFLPLVTWKAALNLWGPGLYMPEFSFYHQFIWIWETITVSIPFFWKTLLQYTLDFGASLSGLYAAAAVTMIVYLYRKFQHRAAGVSIPVHQVNDGGIILLTFLESVIFFWLLGYYADRLSYTLAPILITFAALIVNKGKINRGFSYLLLAIFVTIYIYTFCCQAPHFSERFFFQ